MIKTEQNESVMFGDTIRLSNETEKINAVINPSFAYLIVLIKTEQDYLDAKEILETAYQKHLELKHG